MHTTTSPTFGIYITEERRAGGASKRESEEGSGDNGAGVGDRKKEIWKRLGKKIMII